MKQFILYLFILLPFCVNSQVNETFDGPMLGADWIGKDRGQFAVNADGRLQLNIEPTESGTASIGKEIAYSPDMQWEFDVYMQNQPSDENKLCIYLYQENQERYYYVRLGNTGNKELGLKRNGNGNLILPQTDFEESPLLLHVKVTLEDNLRWSLYYKTDDMEGYRLEGSAMYTIEEPVERGNLVFTFVAVDQAAVTVGDAHDLHVISHAGVQCFCNAADGGVQARTIAARSQDTNTFFHSNTLFHYHSGKAERSGKGCRADRGPTFL